jgi:CRP/FNR family cyclic AMP-dependent transcriptional regulator
MIAKAQSDQIRHLFNKGQPLAYGKGEVILGNTPMPDQVYYIGDGYVKIYSISDDGHEFLHIIYKPGELFPLTWAYLDVMPLSLYFEALTNCTLWRISKQWFKELVTTDVDMAYALSLQAVEQFRVYSDRLDNLQYKKAGEKVAYRLLFLASRFSVKTPDGTLINTPITHEILSNSINLARESASRAMEELEKQHIIKVVGHRILILDIQALAQQLSKPIDLKSWHLL